MVYAAQFFDIAFQCSLNISGAPPARRGGRRNSTTITLSGGPLGTSSPMNRSRVQSPVSNPSPRGSLVKQPSVVPTSQNTPSMMIGGKKKRAKRCSFEPVKLQDMPPGMKQSWSTIEQFKYQQDMKNAKGDRKRSTMEDYMNTANKLKLTEDFSDIYFFSSPLVYFRAVEVVILLNSLYLSMWAVNFISVAEDEAKNPVIWQLIMLIPLLVCIPLVGEIVKTASLLSAIAELEVDVIGSVLESMEDESTLLKELQDKIARRLEHVNMQTEKMDIVKALFYEIDTDRSGYISKYEFRDMLRALHLHYSEYKFKKLFNVIDKDRSGTISEQELTDVVFPDVAKSADVQSRTKIVNEHMEVRNERKKLERERSEMKINSKSKHWARISNLTIGIKQFKNKVHDAPVTEFIVDTPANETNLDNNDNDSSSSSSSDSDDSLERNAAAKVGIELPAMKEVDERLESKDEEEKSEIMDDKYGFSFQMNNSVDMKGSTEGKKGAKYAYEGPGNTRMSVNNDEEVTSVQEF